MLRRCTLLLVLGLVVAVMPLAAQLRIGARHGGHRFHSSFRGGFGFASHRSFFAPHFFGSGLYPYHFGFGGVSPRFAYGVPLTGRPQYRVWVLGATHDWRYWDPTSGIVGGVAGGQLRASGHRRKRSAALPGQPRHRHGDPAVGAREPGTVGECGAAPPGAGRAGPLRQTSACRAPHRAALAGDRPSFL